jgi:glycosyltransferase involved in cell wall biosynthesis
MSTDFAPVTDLVVLSHLRWVSVWQRPQHIVHRLAARQPTWFVEEPSPSTDVDAPVLHMEEHGDVRRVWVEVPSDRAHLGFDDPIAALYERLPLDALGIGAHPIVWLYTPVALPIARALDPSLLVYDVMDDLASFKGAPRELRLRQRQVLREADVVFAGGRSLHRSAQQHCPRPVHLFPSGVEPEHYAPATTMNRRSERPVAGYVGVIDERLDLDLIARLAEALPDWDIHMVGPVLKIDEAELPRADNIVWTGPQPYDRLPEVMAGFHVALMPFALNEATRSISPTKTLEYLAAGLPVVSTRVPDVVADHGEVVDLQDTAAGFADACRRVKDDCPKERAERAAPLLHRQHWDTIASEMARLMAQATVASPAAAEEETA